MKIVTGAIPNPRPASTISYFGQSVPATPGTDAHVFHPHGDRRHSLNYLYSVLRVGARPHLSYAQFTSN